MEETLRELDQLFAQIEETSKRKESLENSIDGIEGERNIERAVLQQDQFNGTEPLGGGKCCKIITWIVRDERSMLRAIC